MKKVIVIAFVIGSFILSTGCSEHTENTYSQKPFFEQNTISQQSTEQTQPTKEVTTMQTPVESETQTMPTQKESVTEKARESEATTEATTTPEAKPLNATAKSCSGKVILTATADPIDGTITLVIDNKLNKEISLFGLPALVDTDGFSNELDPYSNISVTSASTAAGSKSKTVLYAQPEQLKAGASLKGKLFCMGFFGDTSYTLTFK